MNRFPPPPGVLPPPPVLPPGVSWMNDEIPMFDNPPPGSDEQSKKLPSLMSLKIDKPGVDSSSTELVLPKALEDALALTTQRSMMLNDTTTQQQQSAGDYFNDEVDNSDDDNDNFMPAPVIASKPEGRMDKNRKKKNRKKQNRLKRIAEASAAAKNSSDHQEKGDEDQQDESSEKDPGSKGKNTEESEEEKIDIEYIPEKITVADLAPMYRQFYRVFEIFKLENKPKVELILPETAIAEAKLLATKKANDRSMEMEDDDMDDDDKKDDKDKLSKRKMKKMTRLSVAELKQLVNRPDVVEMHDVTARDPKLLVQLKAHRNTVQVPRHWCFKRKYLQGKRGIEKPPFDLPAFIKKTGIMEMRASLQEKDEAKSMKAKMRERVRPKMGKIDIDYQKLHDAFFK